jgi:hypothetical protein
MAEEKTKCYQDLRLWQYFLPADRQTVFILYIVFYMYLNAIRNTQYSIRIQVLKNVWTAISTEISKRYNHKGLG